MARAIDLTGKKFGRLTVLERYQPTPRQAAEWIIKYGQCALWRCQCDCGREKIAPGDPLKRGNTQSCGCLQRERASKACTRHGMSHEPEYKAWQQAKQRCFDANHPSFKNYGERGITMYPQWIHDFKAFLADVGHKPKGRWILDRIDNDRGYEPGNLHWTSYLQSNRNKRPKH